VLFDAQHPNFVVYRLIVMSLWSGEHTFAESRTA
jgi:hypothetical protein